MALTLAACLSEERPLEPPQESPTLAAAGIRKSLEAKLGDTENIRSFRIFPGGDAATYALVLTDPVEKTLQQIPKLRIFREDRGSDFREVYVREGFFLQLSDLTGQDINLDGSPEVVLSINNGGNCLECSRLEILSLRADGVWSLYDSEASNLEDLDGDGVPEIVRTLHALGDADYATFSHYAQITDIEILAWTRNRYTLQHSGYESFFTARIEQLRKEAKLERSQSAAMAFSLAARALLLRLKIDDCRTAWREFGREIPDVEAHDGLKTTALKLEQNYGCK